MNNSIKEARRLKAARRCKDDNGRCTKRAMVGLDICRYHRDHPTQMRYVQVFYFFSLHPLHLPYFLTHSYRDMRKMVRIAKANAKARAENAHERTILITELRHITSEQNAAIATNTVLEESLINSFTQLLGNSGSRQIAQLNTLFSGLGMDESIL